MKWFDKLPPFARHLLLAAVPVVLAFTGDEVVPGLKGKPGLAGAVGVILTMALAILTPLTAQYGVGKADAPMVNTGATDGGGE